jgi:hypothetical protein
MTTGEAVSVMTWWMTRRGTTHHLLYTNWTQRTAGPRVDFRVPGSNVLATRAEIRNSCTLLQVLEEEPPTSFRYGLAGTGMVNLLDATYFATSKPGALLPEVPFPLPAANSTPLPPESWIYAVNFYRTTANTTTIYQALYSSWPCIALPRPRRAPSLPYTTASPRICRRQ